MTHKTHPTSNRLSVVKGWRSRWFDGKHYQRNSQQDYRIRTHILDKYRGAGIASVEVERFANALSVVVYTSRPGILIGRGGTGIEEMKRDVSRLLRKNINRHPWHKHETEKGKNALPEIKIEIREVRETETNARLVAANIADQLERRFPFRRVVKRTLDRVLANKEVKGVKIFVKGRLNGAEMARGEFVKSGKLPLQTLRADVDYARVDAITKYGSIGVKVWIYKGEKLE